MFDWLIDQFIRSSLLTIQTFSWVTVSLSITRPVQRCYGSLHVLNRFRSNERFSNAIISWTVVWFSMINSTKSSICTQRKPKRIRMPCGLLSFRSILSNQPMRGRQWFRSGRFFHLRFKSFNRTLLSTLVAVQRVSFFPLLWLVWPSISVYLKPISSSVRLFDRIRYWSEDFWWFAVSCGVLKAVEGSQIWITRTNLTLNQAGNQPSPLRLFWLWFDFQSIDSPLLFDCFRLDGWYFMHPSIEIVC